MVFFLSSLIACQVMDNPGHAFTTVEIVQEMEKSQSDSVKVAKTDAEKPVDPLFEDPQEDVIVMGEVVEEPVVETEEPILQADLTESVVQGNDGNDGKAVQVEEALVGTVKTEQTGLRPASSGTGLRPATVKDGWRPTLIGTLMDGPTPRAILAMPSGEEKVIKAGDMLSQDGVVVMAIGKNYVELAIIRSAEGRAQIENLTLTAQF